LGKVQNQVASLGLTISILGAVWVETGWKQGGNNGNNGQMGCSIMGALSPCGHNGNPLA